MTTAATPAPANAFDNPDFRKEFGDTLDKKLEPVLKAVGLHDERIEALEAHVERGRGAKWVLNLLYGAALVAAEYFLHRGTH